MAPAGRPRTFDRDAALTRAMHVFWEKGYEGTTMSDLIDTIGVKGPSVYAAFGNKDQLFKEVVEAYTKVVENGPLKILSETDQILDAVVNSLKAHVRIYSGVENPKSCLIMSAAINTSPEHVEHHYGLKTLRNAYKGIYKKRFERAIQDGQMKEGINVESLAEFYMTFVHGMAMRARDGATEAELTESCEYALIPLRNALS